MFPKVWKSPFSLRTPSCKTPINSKADRCSAQTRAFEFLYCTHTVPLSTLAMFIYSQSTHFLLNDQKKFISMKPVKCLNLNCRSISGLESERPEKIWWWIEVKTKLRHAGWPSMILLPHYLTPWFCRFHWRTWKKTDISFDWLESQLFFSWAKIKIRFWAFQWLWTKPYIAKTIALSIVHLVWRFHTLPTQAFVEWSRSRDSQITHTQISPDPKFLAAHDCNKATTDSVTLFIFFRNFLQLESWLSAGV